MNRYHADIKRQRRNMATCAVAVVAFIILAYSVGREEQPPTLAQRGWCSSCHAPKHAKMTQYFRKSGSKTPEAMAYAVLNTKSPRLLAAVAVVETGGNPHIRNTGYKRQHSGAFQVNPRYWGKVPHDAVGQALQAESILSELTETMPIKKALSVYGGDSTTKYQRRVLAELVSVPL